MLHSIVVVHYLDHGQFLNANNPSVKLYLLLMSLFTDRAPEMSRRSLRYIAMTDKPNPLKRLLRRRALEIRLPFEMSDRRHIPLRPSCGQFGLFLPISVYGQRRYEYGYQRGGPTILWEILIHQIYGLGNDARWDI